MTVSEVLLDGWQVDRADTQGVRFTRAPIVDRRKALSRLTVMGGCMAVVLALSGVSAQSTESLWLITWSVIVLFAATAFIALLTAIRDLRRAATGVSLELGRGRVVGVSDGTGLRQFSVERVELLLGDVKLTTTLFDERSDGSGFLTVTTATGDRLLAPEVPSVSALRALLLRAGLQCS